MKKKTIALLLVLMLVFGVTCGGTIAYLTSTASVKNTFTVGNVQIALDEALVDLYGAKIEGKESVRIPNADKAYEGVVGNAYKLIPGHTYIKDPTVTVKAGSEKAYVRMIVTITDAADVKAVLGDDFLPQNFVEGWDAETWITTKEIKADEKADTLTYEFRYKEPVDASKATNDIVLDALFDSFTMDSNVSNTDLAKLEEMEIQVVAHAIQADGFVAAEGKTAEEVAWENF